MCNFVVESNWFLDSLSTPCMRGNFSGTSVLRVCICIMQETLHTSLTRSASKLTKDKPCVLIEISGMGIVVPVVLQHVDVLLSNDSVNKSRCWATNS
jgi:hypothetical protein